MHVPPEHDIINSNRNRIEENSDWGGGWGGVGGRLLIQRAVIPFALIAAPPINLFSSSQSQPVALSLYLETRDNPAHYQIESKVTCTAARLRATTRAIR